MMDTNELVARILKTRKYARLEEELLKRVCARELTRHARPKEALKAAKNQLHIMYGAFYPEGCHEKAADIISGLEKAGAADIREGSLALLALHTSTRERLPVIADFYAHISRFAPSAKHVLDVGCGFAPFALPFMELAEGAVYEAWDLSFATVELINRFFAVCGMPQGARVGDAFTQPDWAGRDNRLYDPSIPVDLALLLKLVPVLEQQRKGLAFEIIDCLPARVIVVSFPIRSLGGRGKSMLTHHSDMFEHGITGPTRIIDKTVIGDELVYVVTGGAHAYRPAARTALPTCWVCPPAP